MTSSNKPLRGETTNTAQFAKERLHVIMAFQRGSGSSISPTCLADLQNEITAVVSRYSKVEPHHILVNIERQDGLEVLDMKVELHST